MYEVRYKNSVKKDLKKIGREESLKIIQKIKTKLTKSPKDLGIPLKGQDGTLWRYRAGDYRVVYSFNDNELWILVVKIGHRKEIYKKI